MSRYNHLTLVELEAELAAIEVAIEAKRADVPAIDNLMAWAKGRARYGWGSDDCNLINALINRIEEQQ